MDRLMRRRWRAGALIAVAIAMVAAASLIYSRSSATSPPSNTFGEPERGTTLAVVRVAGKTVYFPGVVCESTDPELITVALGVRGDPVSYNLAAFLGPQGPDGKYVSPMTTLVLGHRPGIAFDQQGSGSVSVSSDLQAALRGTRTSSSIKVGSLAFRGADATGALLSGTVTCSP
jgi:hypothetical protein